MTEREKTIGVDLVSAWPDWKIEVKEGRLAVFDCKACRRGDGTRGKPTMYQCGLPLSNGAKAVLRSHTKSHSPDHVPDYKRVE